MNNDELKKELEKLDEKSSLKEIQTYINKMIETRGFQDETPQDIMLLLTEELGELAKEIRKTTNIKMDANKNKEIDVEGEIADVFMYILSMCRAMNIDLFKCLKDKEIINLNRKWI